MKHFLASVVFVVLLLSAAAIAHLSGAPPACTGAPGEGTCANAGCHDSYPVNSGQGYAMVNRCDLGNPYIGASMWLTVLVRYPAAQSWGYELTALDSLGNAAGNFFAIDSTGQVITASGRIYATHTQAGTHQDEWFIRWEAPDTNAGILRVYLTAVAANGDDLSNGDRVFTSVQMVCPDCFVEYWCDLSGDVNDNGSVSSADIIAMVNYIFKGIPFASGPANGDVNCTGFLTASDIIYLVNYVFKGGPAPCDPTCIVPLEC